MLALAEGPRSQGEKLGGEDSFRMRVGDYRIVYRVDEGRWAVLVARIKHWREVYRR